MAGMRDVTFNIRLQMDPASKRAVQDAKKDVETVQQMVKRMGRDAGDTIDGTLKKTSVQVKRTAGEFESLWQSVKRGARLSSEEIKLVTRNMSMLNAEIDRANTKPLGGGGGMPGRTPLMGHYPGAPRRRGFGNTRPSWGDRWSGGRAALGGMAGTGIALGGLYESFTQEEDWDLMDYWLMGQLGEDFMQKGGMAARGLNRMTGGRLGRRMGRFGRGLSSGASAVGGWAMRRSGLSALGSGLAWAGRGTLAGLAGTAGTIGAGALAWGGLGYEATQGNVNFGGVGQGRLEGGMWAPGQGIGLGVANLGRMTGLVESGYSGERSTGTTAEQAAQGMVNRLQEQQRLLDEQLQTDKERLRTAEGLVREKEREYAAAAKTAQLAKEALRSDRGKLGRMTAEERADMQGIFKRYKAGGLAGLEDWEIRELEGVGLESVQEDINKHYEKLGAQFEGEGGFAQGMTDTQEAKIAAANKKWNRISRERDSARNEVESIQAEITENLNLQVSFEQTADEIAETIARMVEDQAKGRMEAVKNRLARMMEQIDGLEERVSSGEGAET